MPQIRSKIKTWIQKAKRRISQEYKEYKSEIIFTIIVYTMVIIIFTVSLIYGLVASIAKETTLKSLIEAEATIIGFFGLIVTYALTSLDNRMDRLEQQEFDLSISNDSGSSISLSRIGEMEKRRRKVEKSRKNLIVQSSATGVFLIISLLLSILALGIADIGWSYVLCYFALVFFFWGIFYIFVMLSRLTEKPEK